MQSTKEWRDITQLIREAASEISDGSFIASDSFNYEASMRSINIMNKKVDSGMELVGFETIEERLEHGLDGEGALGVDSINFYPDEETLLQIAECLFSSFSSWIAGDNLNHCMLRVLYMHTPVKDRLLLLFRSTLEAEKASEPTEPTLRLRILLMLVTEYTSLISAIHNLMSEYVVSEVVFGARGDA